MQASAVQQVIAGLEAAGVTVVCYLPDSLLKELYPALDRDPDIRTIRVTNEGEGAAICGGIWLSGKKSALHGEFGIARGDRAVGAHGDGAGIPVVMIMSYRGDLGENNWWAIPPRNDHGAAAQRDAHSRTASSIGRTQSGVPSRMPMRGRTPPTITPRSCSPERGAMNRFECMQRLASRLEDELVIVLPRC